MSRRTRLIAWHHYSYVSGGPSTATNCYREVRVTRVIAPNHVLLTRNNMLRTIHFGAVISSPSLESFSSHRTVPVLVVRTFSSSDRVRTGSGSGDSHDVSTDDAMADLSTGTTTSTDTFTSMDSSNRSQSADGTPRAVVQPPWQNMMEYLTRRQYQQQQQQLQQQQQRKARPPQNSKFVNVNTTIDANALMLMRENRRTSPSTTARKVSKYNAHMNNFHYAPFPPKGRMSIPENPLKNNQATEHPVFTTAKQLLHLMIGNFRKLDKKKTTATADGMEHQHQQQQQQQPPFEKMDHYELSYNAIQFLLYDPHMCPNNNVRAINAAFAMIERLIREISYTNTYTQNIYYLMDNPVQFRMLMNYWKRSALLGGHVLPAVEMIKKIQWMVIELQHVPSKQVPIKLDKKILSMLMQVLIKQLPKKAAPVVAESFMNVIYETIDTTVASDDDDDSHHELHPDGIIYAQLLKAWMDSDLPQTPSKIDEVLDDMKLRDVPLDNGIYSVLIRYWGSKGSLTRIRAIMERMKYENITPDVACLGQAIYGYTRSMQPLQAVQLLEQMHGVTTGATQDITTITACTLNILDAFKQLVIRGNDVTRNVTRAEDIVRRFEANSLLKSRSDDRIHGALMDIYAHAGRVEDVERMMQSIDARDPVKYSILIRAYGKIDRADLAMDAVFVRMMNDPNVNLPTLHIFKQLVEAWIGSSQDDAIEQAYSIFHRMDENELCQKNHLQPDSFMYGALIKVVGASNRPDSGHIIINILDDMLKRSKDRNNNDLIPNAIIYDLALNACYQSAKDFDSAEVVLKRMEASSAPPNLRLYNEALSNYALIGTTAAAERAEQMLDHITELSKTNAQLKPNAFTYNTVINAWVASNDEFATHRSWILYERMREEHVWPNTATFNALINHLSKHFNDEMDLQRADTLLDLMESGTIVGVSPDRRHYGPLMNGWIAIGDIRKAADVLLRRVMTYINGKGNVKERCLPTPDHYYLVANGWIRLEALVEATEFLEQIQTLYEKKHLPEGPDLYSYLTLHSAWTRSSHPEAQRYLEKLDKIIVKARENRL